MSSQFFYAVNGQQMGPVSRQTLQQLAAARQVLPNDLVWEQGTPDWVAAGSIPGLFALAAVAPPAWGTPTPPPPLYVQPIGYAGPVPQTGVTQDPGMRWLLPVGRSGWAIAAGYLGLFSFVVFPAPLALAISIVAIIDLRKHPERHGMGRAIFGLVMGVLGTGVLIFGLIAANMR